MVDTGVADQARCYVCNWILASFIPGLIAAFENQIKIFEYIHILAFNILS